MKKYIVLIGKECLESWGEERIKEWNRPIKEFFQKTYPQCRIRSVNWDGSGEEGYGYGIDPSSFLHCNCYSSSRIKYLQDVGGYIVLTRDQIIYSQNLQNILEK